MYDLEKTIKADLNREDIEVKVYNDSSENKIILVEIEYDEDPKCIESLYYIIGNFEYALVYSTDYYKPDIDIDAATKYIVNTLKFKK